MDVYQRYDAAYKPDVDPDGIMTRVVETSYADGNGAQADENGYYSVDDGRWPKIEEKMPLTMVVASANHQYSERRARPLTLVRLLSTLFTASLKPSLGVAT